MANLKLLQEAIEAFANGEQDVADKKMRKYFVEQAQEINKELEESMEDEEEIEVKDEEKLDEDFDVQPDAGLNSEIEFALGEEDESAEAEVEEFGSEDDGEVEVGAEEEVEGDAGVPSEDQWESIQDAFRGLQDMFDEIGGDVDVDLDSEEEVEGDVEEFGADGEEAEDEFSDVQFGDEKVGESFKLKPVAGVDKKEKAGANTKSPVAGQAKSPVAGVEPVKFAKATETQVDDDFETADTLSAKKEDMAKNARGEMKDVKAPKVAAAAKSRSVLPKSQPKI
ncbi:hypothetical protein [Escherichia phage vB_EcoM_JNE01]|nr:hypothetical protein [Escherichia phage vB_EcoM_JNE01]